MRFKGFNGLFLFFLMAVGYLLVTSFVFLRKKIVNQPPKVEIVKPSTNQRFNWNSLVQYQVKVADKEDGLSEYEEINTKEVMLEVYYLPSVASAKKYMEKKKSEKEAIGLSLIRQSSCFTCHKSEDKLIGPSFESIAKRYKAKPGVTDLLVKKILRGGSGNWGSVPMIAHPDLSINQARQMVNWILDKGGNPDLAYYVGIDGAFRTKEKPAKKVMVLTASYLDHGDKNTQQDRKYAQYSMLLEPAN